MRNLSLVIKTLAALLWCAVNVGCVADDINGGSMDNSKNRKPLISIEYEGGVALSSFESPVIESFIFYDDGYTERQLGSKESKGTINAEELRILKNKIYETDFNEVRKTKFSGLCPTVRDGVETIFVFHMKKGDVRFPACQYDLEKFQMFQMIDQLSQKYHKGHKIFK